MDAQAVEMAPVAKADMRRALATILRIVVTGKWYRALKRGTMVRAEQTTRKKRAIGGNEPSQKVTRVRVHDGSEGCSVAHESDVMSGCAWLVSGDMASRPGGSTSLVGNMVGDMYAGQLSLAMRERLSTTSVVEGHFAVPE